MGSARKVGTTSTKFGKVTQVMSGGCFVSQPRHLIRGTGWGGVGHELSNSSRRLCVSTWVGLTGLIQVGY